MSRFDRGGRRKPSNAPQNSQARRTNWKSGANPGAKGGRYRGGAPHAPAPASVVEKSAAMHLKEQTGRTLDEWVKLVQETGPASRKERAEWLKTKHGLGTNFAAWIALSAEGQNGNGASSQNGDRETQGGKEGRDGETAGENEAGDEALGS